MLQHGIDLHKHALTVSTVDDTGEVVAQRRMRASPLELGRYLERWQGPQRAVVECTGSWYWVADLCREQGVPFHLGHARQIKAIAHAKVKTDSVDAETLAQLLRVGLLPEAHQVSAEMRGARDLLRTRIRMVERRTAIKNSIARILEKHGVSTPDQLPPEGQFAVALHEEQVAVLDQQVRSIRTELWRQLRADSDVQRLWRVPGIGMLGAMGIRLEVGDVHRFPSVRQFFSYCRVVPGADNSGGRRRHKRSKEGNRYLKLTFSHAAVRAIQNYPTIRSFYQRQTRRKNRFIARAIVAKELCRIVYYMLSRQVEYDGTFKGRVLSRSKKIKWSRPASPETGLGSHSSSDGAWRAVPRS